jgi:hypothetical protein
MKYPNSKTQKPAGCRQQPKRRSCDDMIDATTEMLATVETIAISVAFLHRLTRYKPLNNKN